jgi:hypothetical protein
MIELPILGKFTIWGMKYIFTIGVESFEVSYNRAATFSSSVTAASFSGNGASVTNVSTSSLVFKLEVLKEHMLCKWGFSNAGFTKIANGWKLTLASGC